MPENLRELGLYAAAMTHAVVRTVKKHKRGKKKEVPVAQNNVPNMVYMVEKREIEGMEEVSGKDGAQARQSK